MTSQATTCMLVAMPVKRMTAKVLTAAPKRQRSTAKADAHFKRHQGLPGWIYAARNKILQDNVFKVGYTTATPEVRVKSLNTEQRNRTSQVGFFELVFKRPVIDAYGAEQRLFAAINASRVTKGKEFFCMPLDELAAAIVAAVRDTNEQTIAFQNCPACRAVVRFTPLPMVSHLCLPCGAKFVCDERGRILRFRRVGQTQTEDVVDALPSEASLPGTLLPREGGPSHSKPADVAEIAGAAACQNVALQFQSSEALVACTRCGRLVGVRARPGDWVDIQCDACGTHISDLAVAAKALS